MTRVLPYGAWPSPLTPAALAEAGIALGQVVADGDVVWWVESRPAERGRSVLVRWRPGAPPEDVTPPPWNVRTRVHEYGGGAFAVAGDVVCISHDADQRVYRLEPGRMPRPLTPEAPARYADGTIDRRRGFLVIVREDHAGRCSEPANAIVRVPLDGGAAPEPIVTGDDFYAAPRLSSDGTRLAWISWSHPRMPFDGTTLWVAELDGAGRLRDARRVAGGPAESVVQPCWSPGGVLHFVSDASGWWNLWRLGADGPEPLCPLAAELAPPPWVLGTATYGFAPDGGIVAAAVAGGRARLGRVDPVAGGFDEIATPFSDIGAVVVSGPRIVLRAAGPRAPMAIVALSGGAVETVRAASTLALDAASVSVAEALELPSAGGRSTHALHYRPALAEVRGPEGERPPLVVRAHGGPTAAAGTGLDPVVQLFTTRGFAFLDVNYGGSTGYGRAYRERLDGTWGVVDVEDVIAAATGVAARGLADPARLLVRGSSAGGFTVLCALTFHDAFRAGSSWYGIGDLEALAHETHKFEANYTTRLVGSYPEAAAVYRARSPLHHAGRLQRPVLFLQGLDDRVVPAGQAEAMVDAMRRRGVPVAYLAFPGEGHGFRSAATIRAAYEAELAFFATVLGLPMTGGGGGLVIHNWSAPAN